MKTHFDGDIISALTNLVMVGNVGRRRDFSFLEYHVIRYSLQPQSHVSRISRTSTRHLFLGVDHPKNIKFLSILQITLNVLRKKISFEPWYLGNICQ